MHPTNDLQRPHPQTTASTASAHGRRQFLWHYLEMVAAMQVGMAVLGVAW